MTPTTPDPTLFDRIAANAWSWDYRRFLAETGFSDDDTGRQKWAAFRSLAVALNLLDRRTLGIVSK